MALIKSVNTETVIVKYVKLKKSTEKEIKEYMEWIGITNIGVFLEQAAEFILKNCKDWKLYKSGNK